MKRPDIAVAVCTYNRAEMLRRALDSLTCQETDEKFSYEIVVIDDGSTDGTSGVVKEIARRSQVPVKYVREEGKGIAPARNRGIKESQGAWIAFFDDDQLAEPDWLKELLAMASKTGAPCVGGCRLLHLSEQELSGLSPICRAILGEVFYGDEPMKCGRKTYTSTGNVIINPSIFDAVGYFDESLSQGGEDTDFFRRVRSAGLEAWYTPRAVVHHLIPSYRLKRDYLIWNSLRYGDNFAYRDYKEWGRMKTIMLCVARIGQALLVNLPLLFWAYLLGDDAEVLGRKCLLWVAVGYIRETLFLVAPRLFPQGRFFSKLEFRKERSVFGKDVNPNDNVNP